jgi:hypothetical protein
MLRGGSTRFFRERARNTAGHAGISPAPFSAVQTHFVVFAHTGLVGFLGNAARRPRKSPPKQIRRARIYYYIEPSLPTLYRNG